LPILRFAVPAFVTTMGPFGCGLTFQLLLGPILAMGLTAIAGEIAIDTSVVMGE